MVGVWAFGLPSDSAGFSVLTSKNWVFILISSRITISKGILVKILLSGIALLIFMLIIMAFVPATHPNPVSSIVMEFKNYNPAKSADDASAHDLSTIDYYQGGEAIVSACGSQKFFTFPMVDKETAATPEDFYLRSYIICDTTPGGSFPYPEPLDAELARYEAKGDESLGGFAESVGVSDLVALKDQLLTLGMAMRACQEEGAVNLLTGAAEQQTIYCK